MKNLLQLLERLNRSLNKDILLKKAVIAAAEKEAGVILKEEEVSIKNGVLEIAANPSAKNQLRLKEEALRRELRENHHLNVLRVLYK